MKKGVETNDAASTAGRFSFIGSFDPEIYFPNFS